MTNINYELIDTTAPAPEQEPERQRYFIAKCREIIKERELEIGRKLTFYDQTFGCQMNFKDSEKLNGILEDIGYVKADTEKADFVYYNTCTVRENANVRVYGRLLFAMACPFTSEKSVTDLLSCALSKTFPLNTVLSELGMS